MATSTDMNPAAPHHLPFFITAPGESDVLFNVMTVVVLLCVVLIGVFYFRIHALPEHIAHRTTKIQYELVAVLALLSLFTHNHVFWIAGLLLALIQLPDFTTPLTGMADSLARIAGKKTSALDASASVEEPPPLPEPAVEQRPPIKEAAHA